MRVPKSYGYEDRPYLNRELSWLAFYRRQFYGAIHRDLPLGEQLLRLWQLSRQLDEFFMVRVAALYQQITADVTALESPLSPDGLSPADQLQQVRATLLPLLARQQAHEIRQVWPQLAQEGLVFCPYRQLSDRQRAALQQRFEQDIAPMLGPWVTPPDQQLPDFASLSLHLAVAVQSRQGWQWGWIKVPRILARFVSLETPVSGQAWTAVPLEQVIAAHAASLFPGCRVGGVVPFRVTRSADLGLIDSEADNWMTLVESSVQQRSQQGQAVRLEVTAAMPAGLQSRLLQVLGLTAADLYPLLGWLSYGEWIEQIDQHRPHLRAPAWTPPAPARDRSPPRSPWRVPAPPAVDILTGLQQQDQLIHLPYQSFGGTVEAFVAAAAVDPAVLTIKTTLYRTAGDVPMVRSLLKAAKAGKQVVVLVELTTTLDEPSNLYWAQSLEKAGAHVVYGVVGLKTHTNLVLVVQRLGDTIHHYAYIGTGDYLPCRPQPYADLGLLTGCPILGTDLNHLFNFLTGYSRHGAYQQLLVAPVTLRSHLHRLINQEIHHAQAGRPAQIQAQLNVLADPEIIDALYTASQAGVTIELVVRGVCCLRPGVPGLSDRIRVVSILGRYVEHSRILYCHNDGDPEVYIGSADWTPRGLDQRIEALAPIRDSALQQQIRQYLTWWLADTQDAWQLHGEGRYSRCCPVTGTPPFSAQAAMAAAVKGQTGK
ncbi:MAG: polyphosphate kinase 1 [Leptolyngbya sp. RL_3_1]|nr:polyphosphate kinase 1 [Leptolyngbya sp. RL_3_1]